MATEPLDETCAVRDFMQALRFAGTDEDEEKSHAALTAKSILGTSDGQGAQADSGGEHEGREAPLEGCQATGINLGEATGASMPAESGEGGSEQHEAEATPEAGCQAAGQMTLEVRRGSKTSAFDDDEDEYVEYDSDSSIETFFPRSESTDDIIAIIREQENEEQGDEDNLQESPEASLSPGASVEAKGSLGVRRRMAFREPRKANFNFRKKARGRPVQRSDSVESDEDEMPNLLRSISSDHEDEVRDEALDIDSG